MSRLQASWQPTPMKFLHAADIHIDSPLLGLVDRTGAAAAAIKDCTRRAFAAVIDLAIAEDVAFMIIAGDLYDADWRDYSTGLFFADQMRRLGRPCFIARGNHDAQSVITRQLHLPSNVTVFASNKCESVVLHELGVVLHGRSFPSRHVPDDLAETYPGRTLGLLNIGVLHTSAEGSTEHPRYAPCSIGTLVSKEYDYWALGHIHARRVLHKLPWIVFPGNTQGRNPKETGPKGCTLVEARDGQIASVEHRPTDVLRWAADEIDANDLTELPALLERIRETIRVNVEDAEARPLLTRLAIIGVTGLHHDLLADPSRIEAECRAIAAELSDQAWIESVKLRTAPPPTGAERAEMLDALHDDFFATLDDPETADPLIAEMHELAGKLPHHAAGEDLAVPRDMASLRNLGRSAWEMVANALARGEAS